MFIRSAIRAGLLTSVAILLLATQATPAQAGRADWVAGPVSLTDHAAIRVNVVKLAALTCRAAVRILAGTPDRETGVVHMNQVVVHDPNLAPADTGVVVTFSDPDITPTPRLYQAMVSVDCRGQTPVAVRHSVAVTVEVAATRYGPAVVTMQAVPQT